MVAPRDVSERDAIHDLNTRTGTYGKHLTLNLTNSFHSPLTVLFSDLRTLETSTENNGTELFIVSSLKRIVMFSFCLHITTHRIRFKKHRPLSVSRAAGEYN